LSREKNPFQLSDVIAAWGLDQQEVKQAAASDATATPGPIPDETDYEF
jgi:hypothetical protein